MINPDTANWVHSRYHWNHELSQNEMMVVTRALRKEIGGKPFAETAAVSPISDLRAYYLRFTVQFAPTHQAVRVRRLQGTTGQKSLN